MEHGIGGEIDRVAMTRPKMVRSSQPILYYDERLHARGVRIIRAQPEPGHTVWRVVAGEWRDVEQSDGKHSVFLEVLDEAGSRVVGVPVNFFWPTGGEVKNTESKPNDDYAIDFPMHNAHNSYNVEIWGAVSDKIEGLGLGTLDEPWRPAHTSFRFTFQRTREAELDGIEPPDTLAAIGIEIDKLSVATAEIGRLTDEIIRLVATL